MSERNEWCGSLGPGERPLRCTRPRGHKGACHALAGLVDKPAVTVTPEIRPGCTEPDYYEPKAVKDAAALVALLRDVQYEHSRALIELSPALEASIIDAIGRHPRDGDGDE
jgi:hypothetical protein